MNLARHCIRVEDFSDLSNFYGDVLGMRNFGTGSRPLFGYDENACLLEFHDGAERAYAPNERDLYWKLGITLHDLDHAVSFLRSRHYDVTEPHQFRDIGYMCHLRDPKGFAIEFLQHGLQGNTESVESGHPIGHQATLAHMSLRVKNIKGARSFCETQLGMRLMSIQPVNDLDFCLYFFAWSHEDLPTPDLRAIENREWLWQRPYMLLELQHVPSSPEPFRIPAPDESGFAGLAYQTSGKLTYLGPEQLQPLDRP